MKTEIELPIDKEKYKVTGFGPLTYKQLYFDNISGKVHEADVVFRQGSYILLKNIGDWKNEIVFPRFIKKGWIAKNLVGHGVYLFNQKPLEPTSMDGRWKVKKSGPSDYAHGFYLPSSCFDLSFLPKEFWECDFRDSLIEVRHGNN